MHENSLYHVLFYIPLSDFDRTRCTAACGRGRQATFTQEPRQRRCHDRFCATMPTFCPEPKRMMCVHRRVAKPGRTRDFLTTPRQKHGRAGSAPLLLHQPAPAGGPQHRSAGAAEVEKDVNRTNFGSTHPIAVEIQGGVLSGGHGTADGAQTPTDERERGRAAPSSPYRRFLCGGPPTRARSDKRRRWSSCWCATAC